MSTSRPSRQRRQPVRDRDKVELNMELIERLQNNKANKGGNITNNGQAKLLVTFVNVINQSCRENWNEIKEKEIKIRKLLQDQQKQIQNYQNGMTKRVKANDGKIVQYPVQNTKTQDKRVQRLTDPRNSVAAQKTRASNCQLYKKQMVKTSATLKDKIQKQDVTLKNQKNSVVKPFKRYSYHVAIAYKIHLQKMKMSQTGVSNPCLYDPTYHARKLKEEQLLATN